MTDMRLKEMCADEMPREKMMTKGTQALSNTELLAILLRTGKGGKNVIDMAREVLMSGGGKLSGLARMSINGLCRTSGVGTSKAIAIAAAFELGRRVAEEDIYDSTAALTSPKDVFRLMYPHVRDLDHEECWILLLNRSNRLLERCRVSIGGVDSTVMDVKIIIRKALEKNASAVILIHNHPSGNATPSSADIELTKNLHDALKTCTLSLLDHIIVARDSYYSFADEELVRPKILQK